MKAVIMAGGEGSRLRPLTCDMPKPMARLCGRPILEYILDLLAIHGIQEAALTLRYLPGQIIEHFPEGMYKGIKLYFVEETSPLGTAGGVKNACEPEDDNVLIISGDALCDFDLTAFASYHKKGGAAVTILGKKVEDPREYGLIDADETGKVAGFIEKPAFSQAVSDLANTGIYMLSQRALKLIPSGESFDFARDLFPLLLSRGETLRCWEGQGYWCDIGDLDTYISCQRDMLYGKVKCSLPPMGEPTGRTVGVKIRPPVYLGKNVVLEDDVLIEEGSVLDDGCTVGRGARITGSVVLQGAHISRGATLTGSLVCSGASVKAGAMLFEGSTVGAGAVVGEQATVAAGIKIWPGKKVADLSRATLHVKVGGDSRFFFDDDGISGQIGVELTPEFCARVGAAVGSLHPGARIAVGSGTHRSAEVLKDALTAGIRSTGAHVVDFGSNFAAQFEFSMNFCAVELGVFIRGGSRASLEVLSEGLPATRQVERNIEGMLARGEFVRCSYDGMGDRVDMSGVGALYRSQLMRLAPGGLSGLEGRVRSQNVAISSLLRDTLEKLGCADGDLTIEISEQGEKLRIFEPSLGTVRSHTILAICAAGEMERGLDVALPYDAPRTIDTMAASMGRRVLRYFNTPADNSDQEARKLAKTQLWNRDALMQAVMFLHMAQRWGGVPKLLERYKGFDVAIRTLETQPGGSAALLRKVSRHPSGTIAEGVLVEDQRGVVLLKPLKRGDGVRILAEAASSETAQELCDSMEQLLRRAMQQEETNGENPLRP